MFATTMTVHHVFLSHSGCQKDFVEQLKKDLERKGYSCFFDKDPQSLPNGEDFPSRIFEAASSCQVAVVLLTEDYCISKWPMLELAAFVDAQASTNPDLQILPLFYHISSGDIAYRKDKIWPNKWKDWEGQTGVDVEKWSRALDAIRRINGLNFKKDMGEVHYRSEIEDAVDKLLRNMSKRCKYVLVGTSFALYKDQSRREEEKYNREQDAAYKTGILRRETPRSLRTFIKPIPLLEKTIMEGTCWAYSSDVMAHGVLTGFFIHAQYMQELIGKGLHFAQGGCIGETDPNSNTLLVKKFAWGNDFAYDGGNRDDSVIAACFLSKSNSPMQNVVAADRYKRCVYLNIRYGQVTARAAVVSHLWKEDELVLGYQETAKVSLQGKKTFGDQILQSYAVDNHVSYYISCSRMRSFMSAFEGFSVYFVDNWLVTRALVISVLSLSYVVLHFYKSDYFCYRFAHIFSCWNEI